MFQSYQASHKCVCVCVCVCVCMHECAGDLELEPRSPCQASIFYIYLLFIVITIVGDTSKFWGPVTDALHLGGKSRYEHRTRWAYYLGLLAHSYILILKGFFRYQLVSHPWISLPSFVQLSGITCLTHPHSSWHKVDILPYPDAFLSLSPFVVEEPSLWNPKDSCGQWSWIIQISPC